MITGKINYSLLLGEYQWGGFELREIDSKTLVLLYVGQVVGSVSMFTPLDKLHLRCQTFLERLSD